MVGFIVDQVEKTSKDIEALEDAADKIRCRAQSEDRPLHAEEANLLEEIRQHVSELRSQYVYQK